MCLKHFVDTLRVNKLLQPVVRIAAFGGAKKILSTAFFVFIYVSE